MFVRRKPSTRLAGSLAAGVLILVGVALTASSATAGFPGVNGKIAFSRCEDGSDCYVGKIWTMNADGTGQARLFADAGYWDDDPAYSADGRHVVFQRCKIGTAYDCGIATVDAHGYGVRQLTPGFHPGGDDFPSFSPDGSKIVFERATPGGAWHVWIMGSDGSNPHALTSGTDGDADPEFSPDGKRIVYYRYTPHSSQIWLMNADGSNQHPLTSPLNRDDYQPSFSPDGTKIAFAGCAPTGHMCPIWVVGVNGAGERQVTSSSETDSSPAFSPDGKRIVFERFLPDYTTSLFTQALSGGSATRLSTGDDYNSSWGRVPAPSIDSPPKVAGVARAGHELTATAGPASWGGTASFQWLRCATACSVIPGATAATYKPTNADIGTTLQVRQTQTSAGGSVSAVSAATVGVVSEPGAKLTKLIRTGKARLQARLACPATQSVVCNGRLTLTGRVHGHTVKVAARNYRIAAGAGTKLTLRATKALARAHKLTARLVTRDDAGNTTTSKRTLKLKRG